MANDLPVNDLTQVVKITQDEPLFTVRPRYYENNRRGSRGVRASFTLLSFLDKPATSVYNGASKDIRERLLPGTASPYADFLITSLQFGMQERMQIVPVFGDRTVAYSFGMAPIVLNVTGILTDDIDNNWFYNYLLLYTDHLRGTQLARNFELAQLNMNNADYIGVIMSTSFTQDSTNDTLVAFNMQFLVREFIPYPTDTYRTNLLDQSLESLEGSIIKDGIFTYKELRGAATSAATQFELMANEAAGNWLSGGNCGTEKYKANSDRTAVLNAPVGGIVGLSRYIKELGSTSATDATKLSMFESTLAKAGCSNGGLATLKVIGMYGNAMETANSGINSFGGVLTKIQRNLEVLNKVTGYLSNPLPELAGTVANARNQVNRVTDLVGMVKKSYSDLRNINVLGDLKSELAGLKRDFGNLKGSVSSFGESTSDRLRSSLKSNGSSLPPVLGNSKLGISTEAAAAKLMSIPSKSASQKGVLPSDTGSYTSNADEKAVLKF